MFNDEIVFVLRLLKNSWQRRWLSLPSSRSIGNLWSDVFLEYWCKILRKIFDIRESWYAFRCYRFRCGDDGNDLLGLLIFCFCLVLILCIFDNMIFHRSDHNWEYKLHFNVACRNAVSNDFNNKSIFFGLLFWHIG